MKYKIGDKVLHYGKVYTVKLIEYAKYTNTPYLITRGIASIWVSEEDIEKVPDKVAEESKTADSGAYDDYTYPFELHTPIRNDCNATGGYGAVIKGGKHGTSDYERGYKQGYEARKNGESKSAQMIVDYDKDLLEAEYERGLNDAWGAARKIELNPSDGGISVADLGKIFDTDISFYILRDYSAQEVMNKIRAWEEDKKTEIKVGDEVKIDGDKGIVIALQPMPYVLSEDGTGFLWLSNNDGLANNKTGRHFDAITEVLKQMQEEI